MRYLENVIDIMIKLEIKSSLDENILRTSSS